MPLWILTCLLFCASCAVLPRTGVAAGVADWSCRNFSSLSKISTSIRDNLRLYEDQVFPRRAGTRDSGKLRGNIDASWVDARADLRDAGRHAVTGTYPYNIHTGQSAYRPSLVTVPSLALWSLGKLKPLDAWEHLMGGLAAGVDSIYDLTSAFHNGVANPVLQSSVGLASIDAANDTSDAIGTVVMAATQNLPLGERSVDALSPNSFIHHDRAYAAPYYTRTDTQLNIDRLAADVVSLNAIRRHKVVGSISGGAGGGNGGGGIMGGGGGGMMGGGMMCPGGID